MKKIKNLFKTIFSMEIMTIFMLLFAFVSAVATFIENDFGTQSVRMLVYTQKWFEAIMVILALGVVANIIYFKMYSKKKFFIFLIHISFVFILIGAGLTRYFGFEGTMSIDEGQTKNTMLSNDYFLSLDLKNGNFEEKINEKIIMSALKQSNFKIEKTINNHPFKLEFEEFIPNAVEKIVDTKDGKPIINIITREFSGNKSIDLLNNEEKSSRFLTFTLNKKVKHDKLIISFKTNSNNRILLKSNVTMRWSYKDLSKSGVIPANKETILSTKRVYQVGQTQFTVPQASAKGEVKLVTALEDEVKDENKIDAIVAKLSYKDISKKVTLIKRANVAKGFNKEVLIDDLKLNLKWGSKTLKLPFSLKLLDFQLERYPGSKSPSSYQSDLEIIKNNKTEKFFRIFMNNTLDYEGYRFFQSSYKMDESATILTVNKDPGKIPTYIGYFLLFTGLFFNLFSKNGRFRKLSQKKYTFENIKKSYYLKKTALTLIITLFTPFFINNNLYANDTKKINTQVIKNITNIDKKHSEIFGSLLIQDYQGRIKPINSLAIEIMNKVVGKNKVLGLDANQFFLSMMLYPNVWQEVSFIKIKDDSIKAVLEVNKSDKTLSFDDIYTKNGIYKLEELIECANIKKPALRTKFEKELLKVDERLNIAYKLLNGDFFKAFPKAYDENNRWLSANEINNILDNKSDIAMQEQEALKLRALTQNYFLSLKAANEGKGLWTKATQDIEKIKEYQKSISAFILPSDEKIQAELFFNKFQIFENLMPYYLILGLFLLVLIFVQIFKEEINLTKVVKVVLSLLFLGFIIHTLGLALRWYISGHAPWSNGYESMIYIAWAIILSGLIFSKQSVMALATSAIISAITLFVAHLSWMEPQITTLVPVLKSYWLTIHVSVITASYGFLGLSALLGFIALVLFVFANNKDEDDKFFRILATIKESNRVNEMSILVGLVLLVIGNFLGGIWANESWGRYWGWDPKETWTLVSILIYAAIIHLRYIKKLLNDFLFATLSLISYASILMTYFGVNYYLSGKHSYAGGDPIPVPAFVPVIAIAIFAVILLGYKNRKVL